MLTTSFGRSDRAPRIRLGNKPRGFLPSRTLSGRRLGGPPPGPPPVFNGNIANLYEDVGDGSTERSHARMAQDEGVTVRVWQIQPANPTDLINAFTDILGGCQYNPAAGSGALNRELPLADPIYPWLFAQSITEIEGYGEYFQAPADPALEGPVFPDGTFWQYYRLTVESHQRPYAVSPNSSIEVNPTQWYPETGGGTTAQQFNSAREMDRYCTWNLVLQNDYITKKGATFICNSTNAGVNLNAFNGDTRVYIPNSIYTITWHYVPLRLIVSANSYITRWPGRVNQNDFIGPDGLKSPAGTLLYLSHSHVPYTPPVQQMTYLGGASAVASTEKFCHITFTFLRTTRPLSDAVGATPTNRNYILAGHNLLPTGSDLAFRPFQTFSISVFPTTVFGQPTFLSAPLELLFSDCDAVGHI